MTTTDLKPRAIAVLCALRSGPKMMNQLGTAIGDGSSRPGREETRDLLIDMQRPGTDLIIERGGHYYLDHDGLGWLQSEGLDAVPEARIWNVKDGSMIDGSEMALRAAQEIDARVIVAAMHGVPVSAVQRCPHGNMPREAGAGHWRDWHRGHGCHLDPDRRVLPSDSDPDVKR